MLNIINGVRSFRLTHEGRIRLEESLNRSSYGAVCWYICEQLNDMNRWKTLEMTLHVTQEQYDILFALHDE